MKEKKDKQNTNNLLWKFLAIFVALVILFNIDYSKLFSPKEEKSLPKEEVIQETKVLDAKGIEDDIDLEDYLLDEIDKEILETIKIEQIKNYRKYIINTSLLLRKFIDREHYGKEVVFLLNRSKSYPKEVSDILVDLADFNERYLNCEIKKYEELHLGGGYFKKLVSKIFDIKRANPKYKEMQDDFAYLKPKLKNLEAYFYSVEFLKAHLSYD